MIAIKREDECSLQTEISLYNDRVVYFFIFPNCYTDYPAKCYISVKQREVKICLVFLGIKELKVKKKQHRLDPENLLLSVLNETVQRS